MQGFLREGNTGRGYVRGGSVAYPAGVCKWNLSDGEVEALATRALGQNGDREVLGENQDSADRWHADDPATHAPWRLGPIPHDFRHV